MTHLLWLSLSLKGILSKLGGGFSRREEASCSLFLTDCVGQDLGFLFPPTGIPVNVQADGLSHKHSYESLEEACAFPMHLESAKETRAL